MGSWGPSAELPDGFHSLRQNLDPLLADGVENPSRRALWGFVLGGIESMPTVRSGLCADAHGHLMYAWGEETTGRYLARAMRLAGCQYGLHLDMNPGHATFHFLRVENVARREFRFEHLDHAMHSNGDRFLYTSLKDFFYLALRPTRPAPVRGVEWSPEGLPQSPPEWMPALHGLSLPLPGGRSLALVSMALDRARFALRAGLREPALSERTNDPATRLAPPGSYPVLGAIDLGTARSLSSPRGVMVGGRTVVPYSAGADAGWLSVTDQGVSIASGAAAAPSAREAVQVERIVGDGIDPTAPDAFSRPSVAVGVTVDGRVLIASGVSTRDELASALRDAGATTAGRFAGVASERPLRWRSDEALREAYPGTTLYVLGHPGPSPVARLEPVLRGELRELRGGAVIP